MSVASRPTASARIDDLLSWRHSLKQMREENKKTKTYPDIWYQYEIEKCDRDLELLKEYNN